MSCTDDIQYIVMCRLYTNIMLFLHKGCEHRWYMWDPGINDLQILQDIDV